MLTEDIPWASDGLPFDAIFAVSGSLKWEGGILAIDIVGIGSRSQVVALGRLQLLRTIRQSSV